MIIESNGQNCVILPSSCCMVPFYLYTLTTITPFNNVIICSQLLSFVSCTPYLHNAPAALINFLSLASASLQPQPYTNIADLRRRHEKAEEIQSKYAADEEIVNPTPQDEMKTNEVTPNIFQKKFSSLLAKLKLISNLSKMFIDSNENENNHTSLDINDDGKTSTIHNSIESDIMVSNLTSNDREEVEGIPKQQLRKTIYRANNTPIKFTLDIKGVDENNVTNIIQNDQNTQDQMNRFGQVGVFLAEVVGSIVALAYGAVIQLNHLLQPTISPEDT